MNQELIEYLETELMNNKNQDWINLSINVSDLEEIIAALEMK